MTDWEASGTAPPLEDSTAEAPRVRRKSVAREYLEAILFAVLLTLFIRTFVIQAFRIPSGSMENTLLVGDFLFVNKFLYGAAIPFTDLRLPKIRDPRPGDVIVFQWPVDPSRDFIKRVVAGPGQTVEIRNKTVYVDGVAREEPYARYTASRRRPADYENPKIEPPGAGNRDFYGPVVVPEGNYFVLGDNRDQSEDSRYWGFLDEDLIIGKAVLIYLSLKDNRIPRFSRIGDVIR